MARIGRLVRLPPGLRQVWARAQPRLPELNFITIHYACFISVSLLAAIIFWGSSTPSKSVSFTDSLFLSVSAITEAGLNSVNLSQINTWQQVLLFLLILIGSPIFVSCAIVFVRLKAFEKAFVEYKQERLARNAQRNGLRRYVPRKLTRARPLYNMPDAEKSVQPAAMEEGLPMKSPSVLNQESIGAETFTPSTSTDNSRETAHAEQRGTGLTTDEGRNESSNVKPSRAQTVPLPPKSREPESEDQAEQLQHIGFTRDVNFDRGRRTEDEYRRVNRPLFSFTGVGASAGSTLRNRYETSSDGPRPMLQRAPTLPTYDQSLAERLTSTGWISRNSQFHGLTFEERHKLGGREYRAVVFLSFIVPIYLTLWQGLGAIALGAYVYTNRASTARENGQNPFWVGSFNAISAFNNSGMSLLDANMVAFQNSIFMLISMSLFILAGNTGYPIFLRTAVWALWKILPDNEQWKEDRLTLRFLLDHPRRVYTNLFPSRHTWWLAASLVVLNGIDWMFFELLSIGDHDIQVLPEKTKVLGGLFQAFAVRSGGFYVVPIPTLRLSLQFLYTIMMYISVYPVTMSIRNSNVYEERSLGIFAEDLDDGSAQPASSPRQASRTPTTPGGRFAGLKRRVTSFAEAAAPAPKREKRSYFMRQQLRAQLAHDAWFAVLAVFLILIIENSQLERDPVTFSVFNVIFEVISAYATVGMSVGVPDNAYSFSGSWHVLSKLVLCAVMLRGRHRGLPVAIDHAIQLPGQRLWDAEDEDGERRMEKLERSFTVFSATQERAKGLADSPSVILKSPTNLRQGKLSARGAGKIEEER